jgi:tRNA(Ile)-lysidine synthase
VISSTARHEALSLRSAIRPGALTMAPGALGDQLDRWLDGILGGAGGLLLVAVSGGADSMALWNLLAGSGRWRLAIYHLDHQLRADAAADAALIRTQAARYAQGGRAPERVVVERCDIAALARQWHCSSESAGRRQRYQRLALVAGELRAQAVLTAHHRDDQAETVLANLLRGAAAVGRAGIAARRELAAGLPLLRPLLAATRSELRAHCREHGIAWNEDSTNQDVALQRNFLRLRVLPTLELGVPGIGAALADLAQRSQAELGDDAAVGAASWAIAHAGRTLAFAEHWSGDPRRRAMIWRRLLLHLAVHPHRRHFTALDRLASAAGGSRITLGRWLLARSRSGISWQLQRPSAPAGELEIAAAGRYQRGAETLECSLGPSPEQVGADPCRAVLDLRALAWPLSWRLAEREERWRPLGCPGRQTLIKYLAGRGVASRLRPLTAVVADRQGVVWVPGHGIAERVKVQPDTSRVLALAWTPSCQDGDDDRVAGASTTEAAHVTG